MQLIKRGAVLACLTVFLLGQSALAESADYHLKRLEIQAKVFLAQLGAEPDVILQETESAQLDVVDIQDPDEPVATVTVSEQLDLAVEAPTWAETMAREDLRNLLTSSQALREELAKGDTDTYLRAKVELESLARRLRISTSPLDLSPQQTASLEMVMLELEESSNVISNTREQILARKETRRSRSNINVGLGFGYGAGYGAFSPWGYSPWGFGGYGSFYGRGFNRPYRRAYRGRRCR